ncbi:ABC transporter ATP-binding protein [Alkaliphilus hydrothermalis]|uniref:ATP-binding cassette subfamily B protein n=1 Tax=Alkaliphilus hydrothermalis TaxID=1482730 RepID=A0ABS2NPF7_9FIRM|nr:ABC transporter ATP-binding protein [Alkaliphilus hydrothermalis]MBM7614834.1 ATP-binding cassette subfamily B protein [Alkaliphilus hydrothermalis]
MKNMKLIWNYMKGNRGKYLAAVLCIGIATLFSLIGPLIIRITIDSVIGSNGLKESTAVMTIIDSLGGIENLKRNLWIPAMALIIFTLLRGIFLFLKGRWSAEAAETVAKKMRDNLYDHLQHLPYKYHVRAEPGDLIQRCTSDVETVRRFLAAQFVEIGSALFMLIFSASIMFSLDVKMTLVSLSLIPFIFGFSIVFFRKVKKAFKLTDEAEGRMSTTLQENLTGLRVVRAFGRQGYEVDKFEEKNRENRELTYKLIRLFAWYWSISDLICMFQMGMVLMAGIYWTALGHISLGTMVVFITYIGMLLWPVRQLGRVITDMGKAMVSIERIQEIMNEEKEEMEATGNKPVIKGNICFRNVEFQYDKGKPVLKNITFEVKAGETIAILGATGAGKTTLVHLLARLFDYEKGSIKIDGQELRTIDKKWIRKNVGLILQEPFLFAKTIKENIGLGKDFPEDREVYDVAKVASIHEVINDFNQGYETLVGERGVSLSGGQKQRVAIARTLIANTPIIVFDDSLSAVDTETDASIRSALKKRKNNATTFIISHRISTLSEADKIIVLEQGEIVQMGKHDDLMKQTGLYRRIWDIQNSNEEDSGLSSGAKYAN